MSNDFFNQVLPTVGLRCLVSSERGFAPTFYTDNGSATSAAAAMDTSGQGEIYFGCASYINRDKGRKRDNVRAARAFWLDFDTDELKGNGRAPYPDRSAALAAVERLCFRLVLSSPVVIASGYGLHVYWALDADLHPDEWRETAEMLKLACNLCGVDVDHCRTTDIASLLRVPGTHNRKDPDNPKRVFVLGWGDPISHAEFRARLRHRIDENVAATPQACLGVGSNTKVESTADHWFERLSPEDRDACLLELLNVPAVVAFADTSDAHPEPNWRTVLAACKRSGAPHAYEQCRDWAMTSDRFNARDFETRWRSYAND